MKTENLKLIDNHLHLQESGFDSDRQQVIKRAQQNGVEYMVCNSTSQQDWLAVRNIAKQNPRCIIPCFGIHPWYVNQITSDWLEQLESILKSTPSAVGEIGLDKNISPRDDNLQMQVFTAQLQLAAKLKLPANIHCLKAWQPLIETLKSQKNLPPAIIIHAFSGSANTANVLSEMNCYFSFGASVLFANRKKSQNALLKISTNKLLIETDSPYIMPPEEFRLCSKNADTRNRNEPANLPLILKGIAQLRNQDLFELARQTRKNALEIFSGIIEQNR